MDDFDPYYYRLLKGMLDNSVPIQYVHKLVDHHILCLGGVFQLYNNRARVGFSSYKATTVLEEIDSVEIAGIYDWLKMKMYLELIALEQGMADL